MVSLLHNGCNFLKKRSDLIPVNGVTDATLWLSGVSRAIVENSTTLSTLQTIIYRVSCCNSNMLLGPATEIAELSSTNANVLKKNHLILPYDDNLTRAAFLELFNTLDTSIHWTGYRHLKNFEVNVRMLRGMRSIRGVPRKVALFRNAISDSFKNLRNQIDGVEVIVTLFI